MKTFETVVEIRAACDAARAARQRVALVPTMGSFHVGHRSLMDTARAENDFVVVSLFVNPTQFGPGEDLSSYPRDLNGDTEMARAAGVDALFVPTVDEMYPSGTPRTTVHVNGLTEGMCGASRPGHFDGVTTVVAKLFAIVGSSRAYFGRKDFQQIAVVRKMAGDLNLPVEVVGCPLVREPDGLALSSRNVYLTPAERRVAPELHASLAAAVAAIVDGERAVAMVMALVRDRVGAHPELAIEYVEVRSVDELEPLEKLRGEFVIALAARVGPARLIDNVVVAINDDGVTADLGIRS